MVMRGHRGYLGCFYIAREGGAVVTLSRRRAIMIVTKEKMPVTVEKKFLKVNTAKAKNEMQERKGTIKKAAKLKKSKVTKTTDDEYDDEWVQKTIRFLRERPPEERHWELLCEYISECRIPDEDLV